MIARQLTLRLSLFIALVPHLTVAQALPNKQQILLVSLDGFRADYLDRPEAVRLREVAAAGVRAKRMVSVFPSKTYPAHYSIVTGLHPGEHGIIANTFMDSLRSQRFSLASRRIIRDPKWWGGEPLWVTAARQGKRSASYFWPGGDVVIKGMSPTWYRTYDARVPNLRRARVAIDWLSRDEDDAPALVALYFSDADDAGHRDGPNSGTVGKAIARLDSLVGLLVDEIAERRLQDRVNLIVVSDHGMAEVRKDRQIMLDDYIDLRKVEVVDWSPVAALEPEPGYLDTAYRLLKGAHPKLSVYRRDEIPARFRYSRSQRVTSLLAVAEEGWSITSRGRSLARALDDSWGEHGYDPESPSMAALFVASGPAFKRNFEVDRVRAIDLYELMSGVIGVKPAPNSGSLDSIRVVRRVGQVNGK